MRLQRPAEITPRVLFYSMAIVLAVIFIFPTFFIVSTSFQTDADVYRLPPNWLPGNPTTQPYRVLFENFPIGMWMSNTIYYAFFTVLLQLTVCSLAAYAFSNFQFRGKQVIFMLILSTLMVPFEVRMIALYLITIRFNLVDNMWGVIIPNIASPFALFLFVQFFRQIPKELEESAKIDGCTRIRMFRSIIVPVSKNTFLVLGILTTINCWNDFFWPLISLNTVSRQVLSIGIFNLLSSNSLAHVGYPLAMAGCLVMALPLIVVYVIFQKHIINAYLTSGIKG